MISKKELIGRIFIIAGMVCGFAVVTFAQEAASASKPTATAMSLPADWEQIRESPKPFATQKFNSKLQLSVWAATMDGQATLVGNTPSDSPLEIPPCHIWWVCPDFPIVSQSDALANEIKSQNIPGLKFPEDSSSGDLAILEKMTSLQWLDLSLVKVQNSDLKWLEQMQSLYKLDLSATKITDGAIEYLKPLKSLRVLRLNCVELTDNGLGKLDQLPWLNVLTLRRCKITELETLKKSLPKMKIENNPIFQ